MTTTTPPPRSPPPPHWPGRSPSAPAAPRSRASAPSCPHRTDSPGVSRPTAPPTAFYLLPGLQPSPPAWLPHATLQASVASMQNHLVGSWRPSSAAALRGHLRPARTNLRCFLIFSPQHACSQLRSSLPHSLPVSFQAPGPWVLHGVASSRVRKPVANTFFFF